MNANLHFVLEWAGVGKDDQEKWIRTRVSDDMLVMWALRGKVEWLEFLTYAMTFEKVLKKHEAEIFVSGNLDVLEFFQI